MLVSGMVMMGRKLAPKMPEISFLLRTAHLSAASTSVWRSLFNWHLLGGVEIVL